MHWPRNGRIDHATVCGGRFERNAGRLVARLGPLDGLPIGVKDLQNTKGLLTTHGSICATGARARQGYADGCAPARGGRYYSCKDKCP